MEKTFFIQNLGCAKNKCDGDKLAEFIIKKGLERESNSKKADIIILNTCGFIDSSRKESIDEFFALANSKKKSAKLVFAGCMAQRFYKEVSKELVEADYILGNWDIKDIENIIDDIENKSKKADVAEKKRVYGVNNEDKSVLDCYNSHHKIYSSKSISGSSCYIKIAEGCTHRCSFCAIPLIRGTLVSVNEDEVVKSAKDAVLSGVYELNLVAQDLINYGKDWSGRTHLYSLLDKLCNIDGDFVIRLLYIHPDFFEKELVDYVKATGGKVLPYYDIPLQHASRNCLSKMGRMGDFESYTELLSSIRERDVRSIIRSTFMLGFPSESDDDIKCLSDFISQGLLDYAGFFVFSPEEGTRAYKLGSSLHTKSFYQKKIIELSSIQENITDKHFSSFIGAEEKAIIEEKFDDNTYIARLWFQAPEVDGITTVFCKREHKTGDVIKVRVKSSDSYDLEAEELL